MTEKIAIQLENEGRMSVLCDAKSQCLVVPVVAWSQIQADVRAGHAQDYQIGAELMTIYTATDGTKYKCPWVVLDNNRSCEWADGTTHPGLWLGMKYCAVEQIPFDAREGIEATEATAQEGVYYCSVNLQHAYAMLDLSAGEPVPYSSGVTILKGIINNANVYKEGYNRYRDSAIRQWLNSGAKPGKWWSATHLGDVAPSAAATVQGFMAGLDESFLKAIQPVKVQAATNTVTDDGVTDVMYDRFFLQSLEEVYGVPEVNDTEGPYFPYWKTATGYNVPSNGTSSNKKDARKIKPLDMSAACSVRLRSAQREKSSSTYLISFGGYIPAASTNAPAALGEYRALAACVIS